MARSKESTTEVTPEDIEEPIKMNETKAILNEMKRDPQLRKFMVPIPDYGMVSCILAYRILKQLEGK